ncbi:outer membrane protein TolC [Sporomusaceae bacterium BoRhaA]|uniref:TolC family protein n=1 Tax=Pelorhabdus rhamnosifermentans TaxID=2772457 RepID=UPI001C062425|nr:TolC family protein [Pelorhabdus rhamnosifermentans]MBU2703316.1 outer membrane protein TolC [Pelorhabdus rhamnosifermentans]
MIKPNGWLKFLITALSCITLLVNSKEVFAAPIELSLNDSINLALKNNSNIKMAEVDKENFVLVAAEAKAKFGPSLTYTHSDIRTGIPAFTLEKYFAGTAYADAAFGGTYTFFGDTLSVSIPLYTGGELEGRRDQADNNLNIADLEVKKIKQQLRFDTLTAYFNVLKAGALLQVNQETLDNLTSHLDSVQIQFDAGTVSQSDVLSSEVEVANARQEWIEAKNDYDLALVSLKDVTGLSPSSEIRVKDELDYQKYPFSLEECLKYAQDDRPDISQMQMKVEFCRTGVKVAKSDRLPRINFIGSNNWNDDKFPGLKQDYWMVGLTASINVFDSGLTKARIKEAENSVDKVLEQVRQTKTAAGVEVSRAYLSLKAAEARIETSKVAVAKAQEAFRINEIQYREGVNTNLAVIDSQLAVAKAKNNYHQALYDYNCSKAKLDKSIGID